MIKLFEQKREFPYDGKFAVLKRSVFFGDGDLQHLPAGSRIKLKAATHLLATDDTETEYWAIPFPSSKLDRFSLAHRRRFAYSVTFGIGVNADDFILEDE